MSRCSSLVRICIWANFTVSLKRWVLSRPSFRACADHAIRRGRTLANCCFIWGVMLGATALARRSNSALVMMVLHSPSEAADLVAVAGFAAAPLAAGASLAAAGSHTPSTVRTGAESGTESDLSAAAVLGAPGCIPGIIGPTCAGADCGAGVAGGVDACPQASAPSRTHISQRIRINNFLQDWYT